jgi:hypothetical protein
VPLLFSCIILGFLLCAGCSTPPAPATPTPTPTTIPPTTVQTPLPTVPTTSPPSLTPGPTVTLPVGFETSISVGPGESLRTISVRYNGGMAQILLQRIDVRVITSTGRIITKSVTNDAGQIPAGYTFLIPADAGANRVEVTVTINAVNYKIKDEIVTFR